MNKKSKTLEKLWDEKDVDGIYKYVKRYNMKRFDYNEFFDLCCDEGNSDVVKMMIDDKKIEPNEAKFIKAYQKERSEICDVLHSYGNIELADIDKRFKLSKNNHAMLPLFNSLIEKESVNDKFIEICRTKDLKKIVNFYKKNPINIKYKNYTAFLLISEDGDIDLIKWFTNSFDIPQNCIDELVVNFIGDFMFDEIEWLVSNYKISPSIISICLCDVYFECLETFTIIVDIVKDKIDLNLDSLFFELAKDEDWEGVEYLHDLDLSAKECGDHIIVLLLGTLNEFADEALDEEDMDQLERIYAIYADFFDDKLGVKKRIFSFLVTKLEVFLLKWLHEKWDLFEGQDDPFYFHCITLSGEFDIDVTRWLVSLYDIYYIESTRFNDHAVYELKMTKPHQKLYKKVIEDPKHGDIILGIKKVVVLEDEECVICNGNIDMIQLNCGHSYCTGCISKWYSENEEKCPYCRQNTDLEKCHKIVSFKGFKDRIEQIEEEERKDKEKDDEMDIEFQKLLKN